MTTDEVKAYLQTLTLVEALWWFIENREDAWANEVFFYLRSRYRREVQHGG